MPRIHRFATVSGVYHAILTDPCVQDGHLVAVPALREVAIVCGTHPQAVDPASRAFPAFTDQNAWRQVGQGRYHDTARLARCLLAGWATEPADHPGATGAGTYRAVYDRVYGWGMPSFQAQAIAALACQTHGADLIAALNNVTTVKNAWFYGRPGSPGYELDRFYGSRPVPLPHPAG